MRQIVLDTETTGLEPDQGHRIIEIGCVEVVDRKLTGNHFHHYVRPDRDIDEGAIEVHGITNEFLSDKPTFDQVADDFVEFVRGAQLVIHNAPFDVAFINAELGRLNNWQGAITDICSVLDTLALAREKHPGQKNNLDALCKRYNVDNSQRELHGALLDAEILADVYLLMTGGQTALKLGMSTPGEAAHVIDGSVSLRRLPSSRSPLRVISANEQELQQHDKKLEQIDNTSGGACHWLRDVKSET